ncbi:MAG: sigma-70 family RNA polymerase sigma factor [Planctomycetes bacterium]|nr:sigma-70 family RNA polymerase sigma factor [Planctomycetota bacterium]
MHEITRVLGEVRAGRAAAADLLPLVYAQLRELAAARLARESPGHTLSATALVHEAYLRVAGGGAQQGADAPRSPEFDHRGHFFAAAAEAMRRILVDSARRKRAAKHGGARHRHDIADVQVAAPEPGEDLVALDEALTRFAAVEPQKAELVKLRYFVGLTIDEAAAVLDISAATAKRHWTYSKAWLYQALAGDGAR